MKRVLVAAVMLAIPTCTWAQDRETANYPAYYAEISIGGSFLSSVNTNSFVLSDGVNTLAGRIKEDYDPSVVGGFELGEAGWLGMPEIRLGAAYDYIDAHFSKASFTGTLNGVADNGTVTRSDIAPYGIDPDDSAHVITMQAYYSFPLMGAIRPYVGVGVGPAILDNSDTQLAFTGTAGFRAAIGESAYFGLQYRFYHVSGPSIAPGVKLSDISSNTASLVLGFYLN